jgi:uncharacterized membrane protein (DUF106 family)
MQKVVEATPEKRDRLKRVQERMAEFAKTMQAAAAKHGH